MSDTNEAIKLKTTPIFESSRFVSYDWDTHKDADGTPKHVIVGINLVDEPYFDGTRGGGHTMCYAVGDEELIGMHIKTPLTKEHVSSVICNAFKMLINGGRATQTVLTLDTNVN